MFRTVELITLDLLVFTLTLWPSTWTRPSETPNRWVQYDRKRFSISSSRVCPRFLIFLLPWLCPLYWCQTSEGHVIHFQTPTCVPSRKTSVHTTPTTWWPIKSSKSYVRIKLNIWLLRVNLNLDRVPITSRTIPGVRYFHINFHINIQHVKGAHPTYRNRLHDHLTRIKRRN